MIDSREARKDDGIRALAALRIFVIVVIWLAATVACVPVAIYTLPDLEAAWAPPIKDQKIRDVHLKPGDDSFLLWEWSFKKDRKGEPVYITFMAYAPNTPQERYAVDTYIGWDCKTNFRTDRSAAAGPNVVERKVCIKLPPQLKGREDVHVDGQMDFRVGHDWYTVPVKIPPNPEDWPDAGSIGVRSIPAPIATP